VRPRTPQIRPAGQNCSVLVSAEPFSRFDAFSMDVT
jgi:hypothetical protein